MNPRTHSSHSSRSRQTAEDSYGRDENRISRYSRGDYEDLGEDYPGESYGRYESRDRSNYGSCSSRRDPTASQAPRRPAPRPNDSKRRLPPPEDDFVDSSESRIVQRPPRFSSASARYGYAENDDFYHNREEKEEEEEEENVYYDSEGRLFDRDAPPPTPAPKPKEKREGLQGLIEIVNKIQEVFAVVGNNVLDMPQIAVVGGQSSGKSSVLENIVGKDFLPRGSGIVTRRPLILQLIYDESVREGSPRGAIPTRLRRVSAQTRPAVLRLRRHSRRNRSRNDPRNGHRHLRLRAADHPQDLQRAGDQPDPHRPPRHHAVSPVSPIDRRVPVGDQPKDIEVIIRRMVLKFIRQPNCIIMAVTAANTDLANSDAIQLAREVDPEGLRTVGVITKLDLMDRGTDALDILSNRVIPLRLGYVGVINRGQRDIDSRKSMQAQWRDEEAFLRAQYPSIAAQNGTRFLREKLNQLLLQHIKRCLPSIVTKVNAFKAEKTCAQRALVRRRQELEAMSVGLSTLSQMQIAFFDSLHQLAARFRQIVDGDSSREIGEVVGGARIRYVFHGFHFLGGGMQTCSGRKWRLWTMCTRSPSRVSPFVSPFLAEILQDIANQQGVSGGLFTPDQSFINLTKKGILTFYPYWYSFRIRSNRSEDCTRLVEEELATDLQLVDLPIFTTCPLFQQRVFAVLQSLIHSFPRLVPLLGRQAQKTVELVRQLLAMELTLINVHHPDFCGTHIEKVRVEAAAAVQKVGIPAGREG